MTVKRYTYIIAGIRRFNKGGRSSIPAEHGGSEWIVEFWSPCNGVLESLEAGGVWGEEEEEEGKEAGIGYEAP